MNHRSYIMALCASLALGACASNDLQGQEPYEYYTKNPIENKVEKRATRVLLSFAAGKSALSPEAQDELRLAVQDIAPAGTRAIVLQHANGAPQFDARSKQLRRQLRSLGFSAPIVNRASNELSGNQWQVVLEHAVVIPPDCPDWKASPVTTHSNTTITNWGCASTVNLGQMVADPMDLVRGSGTATADSERAVKVLRDYRTDAPSAATAQPAATSGGQ
jgi:pilus biogenesis lipoprotein CpaD